MTEPFKTTVAARTKAVKPSPTLAAVAKTRELRAAGHDIVDFGIGEPDFDTPDHIKDAAIEAIRRGETKYTPVDGTAAVKKAVQDKYARENNLEYGLNQILVSNGGKHVIFNAFAATLSAGDEVIIPAPFWVSYPDMVLLNDGVPVPVATLPENNLKLLPDDLRRAITPKTRWLILNSPSNPTGAAYTKAELRALADVLLDFPHVMILSDDLYEHIIYDDFEFNTIAQIEPKLYPRTLTVNGVAKAYAMTGWRIGYGAGPADLIKTMSMVQSQATSNPCSISQAATVAALNGPQDFLKERASVFQSRRNTVAAWLNDIPGITCPRPEGSFYLFPSVKGVIGKATPDGKAINSDTDFVGYLLDKAGVTTVQGSAFGMEGFMRISYATSLDLLQKGCERIAKAVGDLK